MFSAGVPMNTVMKIKIFVLKQIVDIKTYGMRELFRKFYLLAKVLVKNKSGKVNEAVAKRLLKLAWHFHTKK